MRPGLDAAGPRGDVRDNMRTTDRPPASRFPAAGQPTLARPRILLPSIPWPLRRVAGMWLMGLTLWMACILALFR